MAHHNTPTKSPRGIYGHAEHLQNEMCHQGDDLSSGRSSSQWERRQKQFMDGEEVEVVWYDGLNVKTIYKGSLKICSIKVILEDRTCINVSREELDPEDEPEITLDCRTTRPLKEEICEVNRCQEVIVPEFMLAEMEVSEPAYNNVDSSTGSSDNVMVAVDNNVTPSNETAPFLQGPKVTSESQVHLTQDRYFCDLCSYTCQSQTSLACHQGVEHSNNALYICNICNRFFDCQFKLDSHRLVHDEERQFKCKVCDKAFKNKCHLMAHTVIHTGVKPYACMDCDKSFSTTTGLKDHHRRIHSKEKPFACQLCTRNFVSASELSEHHRRFHAREFAWICQYCSKKFVFAKELKAHVKRMHLNYRPFECQICAERFCKAAELKSHSFRRHGIAEETEER